MVSIIIPVFNVQLYLYQCLQSISVQRYTDWECILIDDGSKDDSGAICDEWAAKDKRFRVIHQSNRGVSFSRNYGLRVAKGNRVVFVDSDDYVDSTYISNLISADTDLVVSGYVREYKNGDKEEFCPKEDSQFDIAANEEERIVDLLKNSLLYGPTNKMYNRSIITENCIKFPENRSYGEDLEFNFQYLKHVTSISIVAKADYHYRILGCGTLSSVNRLDAFENDYQQWCMIRSFLETKGLWGESAKQYMSKRLWGIVYDGLFSKSAHYNRILSIPEITLLKRYRRCFECSGWIKLCVIYKLGFLFRWI